MEADGFFSSCPQKDSPADEVSVPIKQELLTTFVVSFKDLEKNQFYVSFKYLDWKTDEKRLLYCYVLAAMFTRTLKFGTYRTKDLGPQESSTEKMAASLFHSTNLTADGSRMFF